MPGDVLQSVVRGERVSGGTALQLCLDALATSGVYALTALGVQLAYAGSGVLHLALGDVAVAGAIAGAAAVGAGAPVVLAGLLAVVVAAILSALMERGLVQPAGGGARAALAAAALVAGGAVLRQVVAAVFTHSAYAFPALGTVWHVGSGVLRASDAVVAAVAVAVAVGVGLVLARTRAGASLRVTAGGATAAEAIGVDTRRVRSLAFAAAGVLAALGALLAAGRVAATPASGVAIGIKGLCAAAAGGFVSPARACAGAVLIGGVEVGTTFALGGGGEAVTFAVAAAALGLGWRGKR